MQPAPGVQSAGLHCGDGSMDVGRAVVSAATWRRKRGRVASRTWSQEHVQVELRGAQTWLVPRVAGVTPQCAWEVSSLQRAPHVWGPSPVLGPHGPVSPCHLPRG